MGVHKGQRMVEFLKYFVSLLNIDESIKSMNLRQTYHSTLTGRGCCAGSDWWGRHRYKVSWWGEGSTYPIATPIWPKRGYASATAGNSHSSRRPHAKLVLEGILVTPSFTNIVVDILVIPVLTTSTIWAPPPVITSDVTSITYIEDKITLISYMVIF